MNLLRGIVAGCVRNPILVNLLMWCMIAGGVVAVSGMIRESFPQVFTDHVAVEVAYPGANPEDVERAICIPIEEAVGGIAGVIEVSSSANENIGTVWLGLHRRAKNVDAIVKEVKDRVDQITTFPPEAKKPVVSEKLIRTEVANIAVHGEAAERTLKRLAQEIKNDLIIEGIANQVTLLGAREDEIIIELSEEALQAYNLSLAGVIAFVTRSSLDLPAGVVRTAQEELTLRIVGQRYTASEYENLIILEHEGGVVRLRDIAAIRDGFEDSTVRGRFNGRPAVVVSVFKTPSQDAMSIAKGVHDYVARKSPALPERIQLSVWGDASADISGRTSLLMNNGLQGVGLLFLTLALFLGFRYAFWVAADIPLCFAGALILMYFLGQSINMISLFALIIVAGIIVDDSIVIAENIHARRAAGASPETAAIEGVLNVSKPVLAATLTTIIAFVPLMFVEGIMGRFILPIPIIVIAALAASSVDAFCILPSHLAHHASRFHGKGIGQTRVRLWIDHAVERFVAGWYRPAYRWAITHRYVTIALAIGVFLVAAGFVAGGRLPFVLLPREDGNILRARVRFAEGTPASATQATIERIEAAAWRLNGDEALKPTAKGDLVRQVYSVAGEFNDFHSIRGNNLGEVRIELMPAEVRKLDDNRIIARWRHHIGDLKESAELNIARQQIGPTEHPLEIRLLADDLDDLESASRRVMARLNEFAGVVNVYSDLIPGKRELRVKLLPGARSLGLTVEDIARQLRYAFYGGEAVKLRRGRDEVTVRVRLEADERQSVANLESILIETPKGHKVPFGEVAQIELGRGYAQIMHQDNKRRVRVMADIDESTANAERILQTLEAGFLRELVREYPGMALAYGGDRKAVGESLRSLFKGFIIATLAMYTMLAAMLRSYVQPLVIFLTIPFGAIGAIAGHLCLGYNLTMMSLFGLVALSGIVVDHAIIVLDAAHEKLREGCGLIEALHDAGERRFNPIFLSAITDTAGLLPLLVMQHGQAQSVMPMAIAFSFGLVFSAIVTLFLVPAFYVAVNDGRRLVRWFRSGGAYPTAESVEEAAQGEAVVA